VADFVTVARADELAPGEVKRVQAGEEDVALARIGDEFYAVQGACLHLQGPLGDGKLEDHVLTCPWHGWQYGEERVRPRHPVAHVRRPRRERRGQDRRLDT
jgi:nitrite reductase/ring-hydroxylating ferredoxin subunit